MSYARDKRRKEVKKLKKKEGKNWRSIYNAKANQIKIEKKFLKEK